MQRSVALPIRAELSYIMVSSLAEGLLESC